ncbi:MAG TPA: alpha/beta fold hydrolase [Gemmatimonadaceae bacterium]|jgi:pimeloyl-ACP methyl ester carboxylesterase
MNSTKRLFALLALATLSVATSCMLAGPTPAVVGPPPAFLGAQSVTFASTSGSNIHGWYAPGRVGAGAVLLLHGVGANRTSMLGRARFLHDAGFTVLAPDFQAHGESPGEHTTFGALESLDAAAALAFIRAKEPHERVGVIGVSMGGAAALLGPGPLDANAFVLESVYPTIRQATSDRLGTWFGPFGGLGRTLTPAVIHLVSKDIGVREAQLQPIDNIGRLHAPLLLLAGTADPYTPIAEAESLYAHAPSPKSYWAVPGAGHEDLHAFDRAGYERRVGGFLERELRAGTDASSP